MVPTLMRVSENVNDLTKHVTSYNGLHFNLKF